MQIARMPTGYAHGVKIPAINIVPTVSAMMNGAIVGLGWMCRSTGSASMTDVTSTCGRSVRRPFNTGISSRYAHSPDRDVTTIGSTKLYGGGGDDVAHSSVSA